MGIPKFFGWLSHHNVFRTILLRRCPSFMDILAIDLNGIIHLNAGKVFGYSDYTTSAPINVQREKGKFVYSAKEFTIRKNRLFENVFKDILGLTKTVRPRQSLIIAVDGVAPQAKINQQRNRRYKTAADRKPEQVFDSNVITPGTDFMIELDAFLREKINTHIEDLPSHVVYSSHLVPGEGEHKIATILKTMDKKNKSLVVHGADADLIMIYLMHLRNGWENIYLFRENEYNYRVRTMIDLRKLERILTKRYSSASFPLDDFATLLLLNGNDFLPHFPTFERIDDALDTLVDGYMEFLDLNPGKGITNGVAVVWPNFALFVKYIAETYGDDLLRKWGENHDVKIKFPSLVAESCIINRIENVGLNQTCIREFDVEKFKQIWYDYVFSPKTEHIKPPQITQEDKNRMVEHYLEGVTWVYNYYRHGQDNVNTGWYYPYHYAPLFSNLASFVEKEQNAKWEIAPLHFFSDFSSPLEQIVMVIPPLSLNAVPFPLKKLYLSYSIIYDLLPSSFLIDTQGKMENWQAVAILPIPNPYRVKLAIQSLRLSKSFLKRYCEEENLVVTHATRY